MTATDDSLVRRVRKLLDKAEGTTNPHEAEAFSAKAAALIARHRIDPDRLIDVGAGGGLAVRSFHLGRGAYVRARLALLIAVADAHDVRVVFENGPEGMVAHAAGFDDDVEVTRVLYHSLHQQAALQMRGLRRSTAAATQRHRRAFLFGYADRIAQILVDANDAAVRASNGSAHPDIGLAVRERVARVDEFAARTWGRVRSARRPRVAEAHGWDRGARAADGADVGRARIAGRAALPEGARAAS
jgi:Protein of unknown function (DUF2786)